MRPWHWGALAGVLLFLPTMLGEGFPFQSGRDKPVFVHAIAYLGADGRVLGGKEHQAAYEKQFGPGSYPSPEWETDYWGLAANAGCAFAGGLAVSLCLGALLRRRAGAIKDRPAPPDIG